jgi:hypothetical protein
MANCPSNRPQMHRPPCEPVATYIREVRALAGRYGARRVFVATDSAEVGGQLHLPQPLPARRAAECS